MENFSQEEKYQYYRKKWIKEHQFEMIFNLILIIISMIVGIYYDTAITLLAGILGIIYSIYTYKRMKNYINDRIS